MVRINGQLSQFFMDIDNQTYPKRAVSCSLALLMIVVCLDQPMRSINILTGNSVNTLTQVLAYSKETLEQLFMLFQCLAFYYLADVSFNEKEQRKRRHRNRVSEQQRDMGSQTKSRGGLNATLLASDGFEPEISNKVDDGGEDVKLHCYTESDKNSVGGSNIFKTFGTSDEEGDFVFKIEEDKSEIEDNQESTANAASTYQQDMLSILQSPKEFNHAW